MLLSKNKEKQTQGLINLPTAHVSASLPGKIQHISYAPLWVHKLEIFTDLFLKCIPHTRHCAGCCTEHEGKFWSLLWRTLNNNDEAKKKYELLNKCASDECRRLWKLMLEEKMMPLLPGRQIINSFLKPNLWVQHR